MTPPAQLLYPVLRDGFDSFEKVLEGFRYQRVYPASAQARERWSALGQWLRQVDEPAASP